MNKRHYEHTLPNIRGSLSNTYFYSLYGSSIYIRTMHTGEGKTKNPGWPASRISYLTSIFPSIPLTIQEQRKECGT